MEMISDRGVDAGEDIEPGRDVLNQNNAVRIAHNPNREGKNRKQKTGNRKQETGGRHLLLSVPRVPRPVSCLLCPRSHWPRFRS